MYIYMHFQTFVAHTHFFFHYSPLLDKLSLIFTASSLQQDLKPCQGKGNVNRVPSHALPKLRFTFEVVTPRMLKQQHLLSPKHGFCMFYDSPRDDHILGRWENITLVEKPWTVCAETGWTHQPHPQMMTKPILISNQVLIQTAKQKWLAYSVLLSCPLNVHLPQPPLLARASVQWNSKLSA